MIEKVSVGGRMSARVSELDWGFSELEISVADARHFDETALHHLSPWKSPDLEAKFQNQRQSGWLLQCRCMCCSCFGAKNAEALLEAVVEVPT